MSDFTKYYNENLYWHGTGRYHYTKDGNIEDVLNKILSEDGLKPLVKDPWLKTDETYKYTISLAKNRAYASIYAFVHQNKDIDIKNLFLSRTLWAYLIGINNLIHEPVAVVKTAITFLFRKDATKQLAGFQTKFQKDVKIRRTFFGQLFQMPQMRSDIPHNYAIIIAIKKDQIKEASMTSGFHFYEARTEQIIPIEDFSHIEVPEENIEETNLLLQKYKLDIPIIPIESMEDYVKGNIGIIKALHAN